MSRKWPCTVTGRHFSPHTLSTKLQPHALLVKFLEMSPIYLYFSTIFQGLGIIWRYPIDQQSASGTRYTIFEFFDFFKLKIALHIIALHYMTDFPKLIYGCWNKLQITKILNRWMSLWTTICLLEATSRHQKRVSITISTSAPTHTFTEDGSTVQGERKMEGWVIGFILPTLESLVWCGVPHV